VGLAFAGKVLSLLETSEKVGLCSFRRNEMKVARQFIAGKRQEKKTRPGGTLEPTFMKSLPDFSNSTAFTAISVWMKKF
jgi:hypothetical protein